MGSSATSYSGLLLPLLIGNGVWHFLAFWYFVVWGESTLLEHFRYPAADINPLVLWVMQFLGGINTGFSILGFIAALRVYRHGTTAGALTDGHAARSTDLIVLAVANGSQAVLDLLVFRAGLANIAFLKITIPDIAFCVFDFLAAYHVWSVNRNAQRARHNN